MKTLIKALIPTLLSIFSYNQLAQAADTPPKARGSKIVHEFYADVPWQQKLGSYDGNAFTVPFAIPYAGLSKAAKDNCSGEGLTESECILKYGIVNIIGIERIDTLYQSQQTDYCQTHNCVEVILKVGNYSTQQTGTPQPIAFGNADGGVPYKGYVISVGTLYAPQVPWYLSHFCKGDTPGDVCYADYFTDAIDVFKGVEGTEGQFPNTRPWYVFNHDQSGRCPEGQNLCVMQVGAIDLKPLSEGSRLYPQANNSLIDAFNQAMNHFIDEGKFPWQEGIKLSFQSLLPASLQNPFLGNYSSISYQPRVNAHGPDHFVYPSHCSFQDLVSNSPKLRQCGVNYEIHHGGFLYDNKNQPQWAGSQYLPVLNTYSRTAFMYAGIPGEAMPVSTKLLSDGLTVRDKIETASIFTTYMPIVNAASTEQPFNRPYNTEFWHTLYLTNHRIMNPEEFTSGVRGKVLFHDEYRSRNIYKPNNPGEQAKFQSITYQFPASVDYQGPSDRYSAKTCDSCHIRNGSGVPIKIQQGSSNHVVTDDNGQDYIFNLIKDYTFTHDAAPMGLRFIDLGFNNPARVKTHPKTADHMVSPYLSQGIFSSKIMNYYGKMFYINGSKKDGTFGWALKPLSNITLVDDSYRRGYTPKQVEFTYFTTPLDGKTNCSSYFRPPVSDVAINDWPQQCQDVNASGIMEAIKEADIGMILFNANRLVGMNVLEALSNQFVLENQQNQQTLLGGADYAGTINWVSGSRAGKDIKRCQAGSPQELTNCYIGRFGWSAAAGTLEDQVSGGAGYPELNITANQGAAQGLPFRFNVQNCGPANQQCLADKPNSDLNEEQIVNLADYLRWLGVFNRSEYQVSLPIVTKGEQVFRKLNCQSCHVIDKTELDAEDNVLPDHFRQRLKNLTQGGNKPFVSYIGTDLLLHDMGYLSQVAPTPTGTNIRNSDGTIRPEYATYIYKIRTPPLMNLRFNRLVTDSHMSQIGNKNCDFLLHDGRACDAIEAAFLHDGPAVKKLNMIQELNQLSDEDLKALRAFLYSL